MRGGALGLIVFVLLLLPAALAAPAEAELKVLAPLQLDGSVALDTAEGVVELPPVQRIAGAAELLNITLTHHPGDATHRASTQRGPLGLVPPEPGDLLAALRPAPPDVQYLEVVAPEGLVFTTWQSGARAVLAVGPFDTGALAVAGSSASVREVRAGDASPVPATFARPAMPRIEASASGTLQATGSVRALFEGVALVVENATGGLTVDTTRAPDGSGWTAELRATRADFEASPEGPMSLVAPAMRFRVDGALHGQRAWGGVRVDDADQAAEGRTLEAQGLLRGDLAPGRGTVRVRAQGDLAFLAMGDQRQDFARAAAAGAGLALASALAYYGQHLRFLAVPLYARIAPGELLDNEVRRRVHAHVLAHPGADVKGTAEAVGVSWSTAAYHLARLQREGVVLTRRSGRSKRFFVQGNAVAARADAIAALRNPTALAIAELVASRPGLMQKEIGAALHLPASTVSWHMRRLRALGVVAEVRRWRRAEYAAGTAWPELALALRTHGAAVPGGVGTLPPAAGSGSSVSAP